MSNRVLEISDETFKRFKQFQNQARKPHQKTDDYIINKAFDALENKPKLLQEEIEEEEFSIAFPN